ncbi:MAG TPA: hypothetical protein VFG21_11010 [Xanthomonadaceae bacterium]|nr:hypothetical protein [Xanthomonadaceae bacterium]
MGRILVVMALAVLAAACEPAAQREPQAQDKALQRAIQAPQDKARAIEKDVLEARQRSDRALEDQEGGSR